MRNRAAAAAAALLTSALVLAAPAFGDSTHSTIGFDCTVTPSTAGAEADWSCSWDFWDFGSTSNDAVDRWRITFPVDAALNEAGTHDGADPSNGELVGSVTRSSDLAYNGCDGVGVDGGSYSIRWASSWDTYTPPAGWSQVAQYNTEYRVLFFFTERAPIFVIKNGSTGQYAVESDEAESRECAGSHISYSPWTLYGEAQANAAQEWVIRNPSTPGTYEVCITATEVGGTTHTDCDTVTIT